MDIDNRFMLIGTKNEIANFSHVCPNECHVTFENVDAPTL